MLNERIDIVGVAGAQSVHVRFDLPDAELVAIARSLATVVAERYRAASLTADDVLTLRDITAMQESAHERASDGYAGGTLVLSVRRLGLLLHVLREWHDRRVEVGFLRRDEAVDEPVVVRLAAELRELHLRALETALATATPDRALA